MNGIINKILLIGAFICMLVSCLQAEKFVQEVFVYEPYGELETVSQLKSRKADARIEDEIYVQGIVTSSDAAGNYAQTIFFQDETGGISIKADLGSSYQLFSIGQKVSIQCKGMTLADMNGVKTLVSSVSGEGLEKKAIAIDNRTVRNSMFAIEGGSQVVPKDLSLSQLPSATSDAADCLVKFRDVFFQTNLLPFANQGGSSEQYRTLYDNSGNSVLLCTSDGATMAGEQLPAGKGEVTGILTFPNGTPVIMLRSIDDIVFSPSSDTEINDPDDLVSDIIISEYFADKDKYYIEVFNIGEETVDLGEYSLAADNASDGNFQKTITLDSKPLGPFGMAVYGNSEACGFVLPLPTGDGAWDPYRTNYSQISIDPLGLDGVSQVALMKGGKIVDILSTTNKAGWAANKTLIRREGISGHSKASDYTRADAGWITKVAGYSYNLGNHRYFSTDPDFDAPAIPVQKTILELRDMSTGPLSVPVTITGRVTSDREGGNVPGNVLYMQDNSNRGIRVAFKEGQIHSYNPGDEIAIDLYGADFRNDAGLYNLQECFIARSRGTGAPNEMPAAQEAAVSQIGNLQSMYIFIKDVQISSAELSKNYGDGQVHSEDLFNNQFYLSTIQTASFAGTKVAQKSGQAAGIAGVEGDKLLLMPRNDKDLNGFTEDRFVPITADEVPVSVLKGMTNGKISNNSRVTVTVTTDNSEGNMPSNRIFVQDNENGFEMLLPTANTYSFGQTLIVVLTNGIWENGLFTPEAKTSVVSIGAPDPSIQPVSVAPGQLGSNLCRLVTVSNVEISDAQRLNKFEGDLTFNMKGTGKTLKVITEPTASWSGSYLPTAAGSITGLVAADGDNYVFYPRYASDVATLPKNGTRLSGEKVVYFVPSTDPKADLFISETVFGDLDAQGGLLASAARNKCNSKFVELYNPTGADLDLHNYRVACIKYNNSLAQTTVFAYQFPEGIYLQPGHTLVFKYVSCALGSSTTNFMTNTLWPKGYTGDASLKSGVTIDQTAVPGVILFLDARDYDKTIANSAQSFASFDSNDILVVQKTTDGGETWKEIDRLFSLKTTDGSFGGKVSYVYLHGYQRKPGVLGITGNVIDCPADIASKKGDYLALDNKKNHNDFDSVQCDPEGAGRANWTQMALGDVGDLGVHTFSIE